MGNIKRNWEYCTLVVTDTCDNRTLVVTFLRTTGKPEGCHLQTPTLGTAIAQLGAEGWEMCGFYTVKFPEGLGQQFFFKRLID